MMLNYHQVTFNLLNITPEIDDAAVTALAELAQRIGRDVPAAVREWYRHKDAAENIVGNHDHPLPVDEFIIMNRTTRPAWDWFTQFIEDDLLCFVIDSTDACLWALQLDGTRNPRVMTRTHEPDGKWYLCGFFGEFVYGRVWDTLLWRSPYVLTALAQPFSQESHNLLRERCTNVSSGISHPMAASFRYASPTCRALLKTSSATTLQDWHIAADSRLALHQFLSQLQEDESPVASDTLRDLWQAYEKAEA